MKKYYLYDSLVVVISVEMLKKKPQIKYEVELWDLKKPSLFAKTRNIVNRKSK